MPNNLIFSNVASNLQTQIFGQNGNDVKAIQTDANGNMVVTGTVTAIIDSGTITALLSTVTAIIDSGTITALVSTVTAISIPQFTETNTTLDEIVDETVAALTVDTSMHKIYSFYVNNTSGATVTAYLQISPTTDDALFVNDGTQIAVAGSSKAVLVAEKFLKFTRVMIEAGVDTASADVYFNGQS